MSDPTFEPRFGPDEARFSMNEVRPSLEAHDIEIICAQRMLAQVMVWRPSDNSTPDGLSSKFAVTLYLSPRAEMAKHDDAYGYDFNLNRLLTLDEVVEMLATFGIAMDAKVWQVTLDPNSEQDGPHLLSDLGCLHEN